MKRIWSPLAFCVVVLTATPLLAAENDSLAAKGRVLVEGHCARCHAIGPTGDSPHAEAPPFRVVATRWPLENLEEALAEGIVTGHPDMPAFELEPPNIEALIEYFYTLLPEGARGEAK